MLGRFGLCALLALTLQGKFSRFKIISPKKPILFKVFDMNWPVHKCNAEVHGWMQRTLNKCARLLLMVVAPTCFECKEHLYIFKSTFGDFTPPEDSSLKQGDCGDLRSLKVCLNLEIVQRLTTRTSLEEWQSAALERVCVARQTLFHLTSNAAFAIFTTPPV